MRPSLPTRTSPSSGPEAAPETRRSAVRRRESCLLLRMLAAMRITCARCDTRVGRGLVRNAMSADPSTPVGKIGLLWRGDRDEPSSWGKAQARLGPLFAELADRGVAAEPVVYSDDTVDVVRAQLLGLAGVLVWVNPIQDGANRAVL